MVANLNRLPVKRVHHAKRYDAKRNAQYGPISVPAAAPANVVAVAAPPPAAAPVVPSPAPAPPVSPAVSPAAPPAAPPPAASPAASPPAAPPAINAPSTTAPAPITIKPVSAASSAKTAPSSTGGAPSPVLSATRLSVKPVTTSTKPKSSAAPTSTSLSPGHTAAGSTISSSSKGLSGAGIAGIIIGIIIFIFAVFLFVKRKRAIMMRKGKRNWERDLFPKHDEVSEKSAADTAAGQYAFQGQNSSPFAPPLTPLSASYNNPTYFAPPTPTTASGGQIVSTFNSSDMSSKPTAIIRCTFIPSLPDELSITTGEIVTIVNEYDDGWALCANVRGEQGMVPLECLQKEATTPTAHESDWKNAQRASSLIFRDGVRY